MVHTYDAPAAATTTTISPSFTVLSAVPIPRDWIVSSLDDDDEEAETETDTDAADDNTQNDNHDNHINTTSSSIPTTTRLILHFDINETILLGDEAGGDSRHDSVQKMLAKSAFVQMTTTTTTTTSDDNEEERTTWDYNTQQMTPTHWWDGQEIGNETTLLPPPLYTGWKWPPNCCPYYRTAYKNHAQTFCTTEHHPIYQPLLERCEAALAQSLTNADDHILPAFYETLAYLIQQQQQQHQQPFTLVFRTFGSDLERMAQVISNFARGRHPQYPHIHCPELVLPPTTTNLYQGRWKKMTESGNEDDDAIVVYQLWNYPQEDTLVASGDAEILQLLQQQQSQQQQQSSSSSSSSSTSRCAGCIIGIRDDYAYWKEHDYHPTAGKPIWVPTYHSHNRNVEDTTITTTTSYPHHLFFDDNIHNLAHDGIACVRQQQQQPQSDDKDEDNNDGRDKDKTDKDATFRTVDGHQLASYQGTHLVRVPTVEPVLNPHWYIQKIQQAQQRLQRQLQQQEQRRDNTTRIE